MFHALQKVDLRTCYTKQKINLACPRKVLGEEAGKKIFFTYFSEDLALPISFIQPVIAYF